MRAGAILLQLSVQPLQIIVQVTALHWYGLHGVTSSDMLHLTLNTGHVCRSPRSKVRVGMVEKLRPFCRPGRHVLPDHRDWTMQLAGGLAGGLFFTVFDAVQPAVSCGVAGNDGAADEIMVCSIGICDVCSHWTLVRSVRYIFIDKGTPDVSLGRKATGPLRTAGLPKWEATLLVRARIHKCRRLLRLPHS